VKVMDRIGSQKQCADVDKWKLNGVSTGVVRVETQV
jgi:hypothetical protein